MKKYLKMIKEKFPFYVNKFYDAIPFLLIYQAILFILSPLKINQVVLAILIVVFTFTKLTKD